MLDSIPELKSAIGGEVASENKMTSGLIGIFLLSLLLMYFILCAQFESFTQPLIVLAEIPVDIAFAMLVLMCCGYSLNIMSGIGLIASCGIVINDSFLLHQRPRFRAAAVARARHDSGSLHRRPCESVPDTADI